MQGCDPVLHLYAVLIDFKAIGRSRAEVMTAFNERDVGTQVHYVPVHLQPYYRKRYGDIDLPGARAYYARCLSLPLYPAMELEEVDLVVDALKTVLGDDSHVRQAAGWRRRAVLHHIRGRAHA